VKTLAVRQFLACFLDVITLLPSATVGLALNIVMLYVFYVLSFDWHKYWEHHHHNHGNNTTASPVEGVTDVDEVRLTDLGFTTL